MITQLEGFMRTKKGSLILFILCLLLIGGCGGMEQNNQGEASTVKPSEMDETDLPKNRAFEQEFTRGFLQSTEEIEDGYYPFVSGTGRYKMWFPAGTQIGDKGYIKEGDYYENYQLHVSNDSGSASGITINYQALRQQEFYEDNLESLEKQTNKDLVETADTRITKMVQKFDEQVDDMKTQSMTIYYEIIPSD
jgi:hypothetical protein